MGKNTNRSPTTAKFVLATPFDQKEPDRVRDSLRRFVNHHHYDSIGPIETDNPYIDVN